MPQSNAPVPTPVVPIPQDAIPLCAPELGGNEWQFIKECLDTNFVSSVGPFVDRFERELAARVGAQYAVATVNGTAALHIALLVAGVQHDDEVLIPTLTFIAPVNAIRYVGAWPVFIDAEPSYWQMDVRGVEAFLNTECYWIRNELRNKTTGRRVRAILPVHILGHPVDMDPILAVAQKFELTVIEDASEGLGAKYKGRMVGTFGHIACFSFNGNKIITTGGGGMLVTNNEEWARRAKYLTTQAKDDPVEFVHDEIGYNYRLTNIQAALGCAQLELLDSYISRKRQIAASYAKSLDGALGLTLMQEAPWAFSTFWLYTILVDPGQYGKDSRALLKTLNLLKIQTRPLWQPIHRSLAHSTCQAYKCHVAEQLNACALSLPSSVGLTENQQRWVIDHVRVPDV